MSGELIFTYPSLDELYHISRIFFCPIPRTKRLTNLFLIYRDPSYEISRDSKLFVFIFFEMSDFCFVRTIGQCTVDERNGTMIHRTFQIFRWKNLTSDSEEEQTDWFLISTIALGQSIQLLLTVEVFYTGSGELFSFNLSVLPP